MAQEGTADDTAAADVSVMEHCGIDVAASDSSWEASAYNIGAADGPSWILLKLSPAGSWSPLTGPALLALKNGLMMTLFFHVRQTVYQSFLV